MSAPLPEEPTSRRNQAGNEMIKKGQLVLILVRLLSYVDVLSVKVVPGYIQEIYEKDVVVFSRYGLGRVLKRAVLSTCRSWNEGTLRLIKDAAIWGRDLEQFPVMEEVFPGSLLPDSQPNPSPHSGSPSSSDSFSTHQSRSYGFGRNRSRGNCHQPSRHHRDNFFSGREQSAVYRSSEEAALPHQENGFQAHYPMPQVQPTYSPMTSPVVLGHLVVVQHSPFDQGQSQTFQTQPCTALDYRMCLSNYSTPN